MFNRIDRGDCQIYYEVYGSGYPVIFIHGGGGNTLVWFQQVPHFSKKRKVITVDLRGFKNSKCPPDRVHPRFFPADIRAIIQAEGLAQAALVCQSLGAWAGLPIAVRSPEMVSCIAINGSPTPAYSEQNWEVLRSSGAAFKRGEFGGFGRTGGLGWAKDFVTRRPEMFFLYSAIKNLNGPFEATTMQEDMVKLNPSDFAHYKTPTLIMGGSQDNFLTPESHLHVASLIPGAVVHTFQNAGHSAYFETPDEFNLVVSDFLDQHIP